jgi:hypothetical protein
MLLRNLENFRARGIQKGSELRIKDNQPNMKPFAKAFPKVILGLLAIGGFFCQQANAQGVLSDGSGVQHLSPQLPAAPGPIVGNITFAGTVSLDSNTVNTATKVMSWAGPSPTPTPNPSLPEVQSRDGSFAATVNVGDLTTFAAPWSFNTSTTMTNFWSVDNFTFDLTTSHIAFQGSGFLVAQGTGTVKASGFIDTPGTWNFSTQDGSASGKFSFSASTSAVPEGSTVALLSIGLFGMAGTHFLRKKRKPFAKMNAWKAFFAIQ